MSRPIKFRVWIKKEQSFHLLNDLYWFEENYVYSFDDSDFIFQQFTGLQDKNGTDIYEGDIVKTIYSDDHHIGEIIFHSETCMFRIKTKSSLLPVVTLRVKDNQDSNLMQVAEEVVGNIFGEAALSEERAKQ